MTRLLTLAGLGSLLLGAVTGIEINLQDPQSVKDGASTVAFGLLKYYTGNNTGDVPGNLPDPYFWWEAGAMFGTLIDYWYITGDETYNEVITQAMLHQASPGRNFMPENQTRTEGNDDQGFWAMSAMSAAENNFPNPPEDQPQWLALVQAVFNMYVSRWEPENCNGGLRWQILALNQGFNYKNSISNGCFFNLAARLARYTGNQTYAEWAAKVYDWQTEVGFITDDFSVEDGAHVEDQCAKRTEILWSYNAGIFLHGASVMYNLTGDETWKTRTDGLLQATTNTFFNNSIAFEPACEPFQICNIDQRSFKGYLLRWLAATTHMAPHTVETIMPLLSATGEAAARSCDGSPPEPDFRGIPGTACGLSWIGGTFDFFAGVGEQMSALSALMYTQIRTVAAPVTADTGGTSIGDPNAGMDPVRPGPPPIEVRDKVAASFLTVAICLGVVGGSWFVVAEEL